MGATGYARRCNPVCMLQAQGREIVDDAGLHSHSHGSGVNQ